MPTKQLDPFQKQLFKIYLILLKTSILPEELKLIEEELYTANKMYKYDKEIIRLLNVYFNYKLSNEDKDKYAKLLRKALNSRNTLHKTANSPNFENTSTPS